MNRDEYEHYEMQQDMQREQIDKQTAPYSPQLHQDLQQAQAVLVEQTNPSKVVESIILRLRGVKKNPDGSEEQVATPKMNKIGIENMWFILDSHINQNVILSHLDKEEIGRLILALSKDLVTDLRLNWRNYGITQKTDLDAINNSILYNIFLSLKRAEGQNEKNWLGKISIENISGGMQRMPRSKKDSFWSKFKI